MNKKILIIDYGIGNLRSVYQAVTHLGYECELSNKKKDIENAYKIILPGVGAFGAAISKLKNLDLIHSIEKFKNKGNYLLGVCLGMQLMLKKSFEFGQNDGLNFVDGQVVNLNTIVKSEAEIPHIGWCKLENIKDSKNKIFKNIENEDMFYFIHSYYSKIIQKNDIEILYSIYNDSKFTSMFINENIIGVQFHPEKSGASGLKLLYNFLQL